MEDELLTMQEASKILKTNVNFVHSLRKAGLLRCMYCGSYKVRKLTLMKFLEDYDGKDLRDLGNIKELKEEENEQTIN